MLTLAFIFSLTSVNFFGMMRSGFNGGSFASLVLLAFKAWTTVNETSMMIGGNGLEGGVYGFFEGLGAIVSKRRSAAVR
jgi:hypothetical protein